MRSRDAEGKLDVGRDACAKALADLPLCIQTIPRTVYIFRLACDEDLPERFVGRMNFCSMRLICRAITSAVSRLFTVCSHFGQQIAGHPKLLQQGP